VLRLGPLFWLFVLLAAGFARYIVLAVQDEDRALAGAAAVAFVVMCAAVPNVQRQTRRIKAPSRTS
jgi:hypothetical protein